MSAAACPWRDELPDISIFCCECLLKGALRADVQQDVAGPADVIGEAAAGGVGGVVANLFARAGGGTPLARRDAFALGERGAILHHLDQAALIPHVVEAEGREAPVEARCTHS